LYSCQSLLTFDHVSLFINVPDDEALQVVSNELHNNDTLMEWSVLQAKAIMGQLEVHFRAIYFQVDDKFLQQKDGMDTGSSLSPIISNIYMEPFKKLF
jgi:hypothetical protein